MVVLKTHKRLIEDGSSYSLGFTAASLRPDLARIIAETYLSQGDWEQTKQKVLGTNALQSRSKSSGIRMEREIRQRLQTLTRQQLEILAHAPSEGRRAIAWLSVLKHSAFIFTFAAEVLRAKLEISDFVFRPSDYEGFYHSQSIAHPELAVLNPSTQAKLRGVLKTMMREVGILEADLKNNTIHRPIVPHDVMGTIMADNRKWLAGFLIPDSEIASLRE